MTLFPGPSLDELRSNAAACTACDLYKEATQTVFGEGPRDAGLVLMGEVPGDKEDLAGHPFVGPAGKVLDDALEAAGIDRTQAYLTNAVKHFKFERRGKVRIHKKPNAAEVAACKQWWEAEVDRGAAAGARAARCGRRSSGVRRAVPCHQGARAMARRSGWRADARDDPPVRGAACPRERRDQEYAGLVRDLKLIAERVSEV